MHIKKKIKTMVFGIVILGAGVMALVIPVFLNNEEKKKELSRIDNYIVETSYLKKDILHEETLKDIPDEEYIMVLEIPKINLKKGLYPKNYYKNSINYNVAIMEESTMPDEQNNNLVLAAHNGNSKISFFDKLDQLQKNDEAYIYYQGVKYIYKVDEIYDVFKDGSIEIKRNQNKNTLTLITCRKNTKDKQFVIILYLMVKENY